MKDFCVMFAMSYTYEMKKYFNTYSFECDEF